jgi:hypothetical protein
MTRANYQVMNLPMTEAVSRQTFEAQGNLIQFIDAVDAAGAQTLDAYLEVQLDDATDDWIPFRLNSTIEGPHKRWQYRFKAQPGITARILHATVEGVRDGVRVSAPPAKQLVTSAAGAVINTGRITVGTSAVQIRPANTLRQNLTIRNRSNSLIQIGNSAVTATTGFDLEPNEAFRLDGSTGALFAIAPVAGCEVHWMEQG